MAQVKALSKTYPSMAKLSEFLELDNESPSGLRWKKRQNQISETWNTKHAGKPAGSKGEFHWRVHCFGGRYLAHRIVWILAYGSIPEDMVVDHIDGDGFNNAIENLRLATVSENAYNRVARKGNFKNVWFVRQKMRWAVEVWRNRIRYPGGHYHTEQEAAEVAKQLREMLHGAFANHKERTVKTEGAN